MDLSSFFSLAEMTRSETARRENIPNQPAETEVQNLRALCAAVLDPLRTALEVPIKVNSGYRSPELNRRIGGAAKSQHVEGKAADIQVPGMGVLELFKAIIRQGLPFDQIIYEAASPTSKWVHVSHDPARDRRQIMVALFGSKGRPTGYPVLTREAALAFTDATRSLPSDEQDYVELGDDPGTDPPAEEPERPGEPRRPARKAKKRTSDKRAVRKKQSSPKTKTAQGKKKKPATKKPRTTKRKSTRRSTRKR
jgi:zinc D-Ala-D-Ala carboxypeptidase